MELLQHAIDLVLHLDKHLAQLVTDYGAATHWILFAVVFCETGLVVTPFLPGDSLLFAAGAIAALDTPLNIVWLWVLLTVAAIVGDTVNYAIGKRIGCRAFAPGNRFLKQEHVERTHAFFEKHGPKTIVLARFVPIVRTFAPFVAGVGVMSYGRFITYNVLGGVLWTTLFLGAGYYFGNLDFVKRNFSLVILVIIVLSVLPMVWEWWKARREGRARAAG
jgi:membrane-associated protein